jgi:hypothetical protein
MPLIALATCQTLPEADWDEELLVEACQRAGLTVELPAWDDPTVDWSKYDLVLPRSTWNYYERPNDFRRWIRQVDEVAELWNPAGVMLSNIHKSYLLDLAEDGIDIVPTLLFEAGTKPDMATIPWSKFVVKPAVSASSYLTHVFTTERIAEAEDFLNQILKDRDAMVQEYMNSVPQGGEVALIHIDGELTHGITKHPRYHGGEESVSEAFVPLPEQTLVAAKVIGKIKGPWLYARVDLMLGNCGRWLLSELELIEPSLFFRQHEPALDRFVSALCNRV